MGMDESQSSESKRPDGEQLGTAVSCEAFAAMLNLSGKRRHTSQRIVLYAVLSSLRYPGALTHAFQALEDFRRAHVSLMNRSDVLPGVFCEELKEAYFGDDVADARIRSFIDLAEGTLVSIGGSSPESPELLLELVNGSTTLLEVLDRITTVYEEVATRHARSLKAEIKRLMNEIETSASEAHAAVTNARAAARNAGPAAEEFSQAAETFSTITRKIDSIAKQVLGHAAA